MKTARRVVVIGGGIGGLTTGAVLARRGFDVTVLENHIYPGGCAGTFYHRDYYFDAGATLAGGFYPGGPMDVVARQVGIEEWGGRHDELPMLVHLPDGARIARWADERRWEERGRWFSPAAADFWRWQEQAADHLWEFAVSMPPWPFQTVREGLRLLHSATRVMVKRPGAVGLMRYASSKVLDRLPVHDERLRLFVDAQLLIASQARSAETNALYGASALDLPRREVRHFQGGIGAIARRLERALEDSGGRIRYRRRASRIRLERGRVVAVETNRKGKQGEGFDADVVVANLVPQNLVALFDKPPSRLTQLAMRPGTDYGAFVAYVGVPSAMLPADGPLHHQVVVAPALREAKSAFVSISPDWDPSRAPAGHRAVTVSTHTRLASWWQLFDADRADYERRKDVFARELLTAASVALPGIESPALPSFPGTPVTFHRFTNRKSGWVGGYPQESLFQSTGPAVAPGVWMVGDTIFPGQSTAAVAMGALRVADAICDAQ